MPSRNWVDMMRLQKAMREHASLIREMKRSKMISTGPEAICGVSWSRTTRRLPLPSQPFETSGMGYCSVSVIISQPTIVGTSDSSITCSAIRSSHPDACG